MTPDTLPDSGARSEFPTGAVRDASIGKGLPSRIPPAALRALAKRFEDGERKYPDVDGVPNWMRGIPLSRFFDSAFRHLLAAAEGDTTEDHFGGVLWNITCWIWTEDEISAGRLPSSLDDLPFARHEGDELPTDLGLTWLIDEDPPRYEFDNIIKPGDRVRVTDSGGFGEPYEFEAVVRSIEDDGRVFLDRTPCSYRLDQITLLP